MASIQTDSVQFASLLTESSVAETPPAASQSKWRRPVLFAVATMAVLGVLVSFSTAQSGLLGISTTTSVQPLMLMQDLRMLSDDHYLPYDSGKSKQENMNMAFDHFVAKALNNELTAEEKTIFKQHFIGAMTGKCKAIAKPTASQWKDWLKDAFEGTKPELTDAIVTHINSGNNGFTVSKEPWMKETTHDDIKSRLGMIQPPGDPPPAPIVSASDRLPAQKEFHAYEKWPHCAVVVRRDHNQGTCGSCWAFAAMSVLDSRLCIKTGGDFKEPKGHLSRTYATSCSYESRDGCQGGWPSATFELAGAHGIPTGGSEGCLPYFAHGEGTDHFDNQQVAPPCPHACVKAGYGRSLSADKFKFAVESHLLCDGQRRLSCSVHLLHRRAAPRRGDLENLLRQAWAICALERRNQTPPFPMRTAKQAFQDLSGWAAPRVQELGAAAARVIEGQVAPAVNNRAGQAAGTAAKAARGSAQAVKEWLQQDEPINPDTGDCDDPSWSVSTASISDATRWPEAGSLTTIAKNTSTDRGAAPFTR